MKEHPRVHLIRAGSMGEDEQYVLVSPIQRVGVDLACLVQLLDHRRGGFIPCRQR